MGFCLISFELAKIQRYDFAVCSVTIYYCRLQKMVRKFGCVRERRTNWRQLVLGDNWSSTSTERRLFNIFDTPENN